MESLDKCVLSTNILALHIHDNILLVGEGSYLSIYDVHKYELCSTSKIFVGSSIHCIKKCFTPEINVIFFITFGQKSFALASLDLRNADRIVLSKSKEYYVDDWIIDIIFCKDNLSIIIVTAHNYVIQYSISILLTETKKSFEKSDIFTSNKINDENILDKKYCSENSLLYCGQIYGSSLASCIVFSGTAFGQIHIWAPWTLHDKSGRHLPITSLSGIKGAVFSIYYNEANNLIGATSDDRSVRIWKVCFPTEEVGGHIDWQTKWTNCSLSSIFCAFGHSARVWRSEILDDETVLSCGEDSTVCHWSNSGYLLTSWVAHPSASVWCMTYNNGYVFTGGGDGAIKKWNLSINNRENIMCLSFPRSDNSKNDVYFDIESQDYHGSRKFDHKKHIRAINLIDSTTYSVITNEGSVWVFKESENLWNHVFQDVNLKGYIITSVNIDSTLLALGTLFGYVAIFDTKSWKCLCQQLVGTSKIQSLFFLGKYQLNSCTVPGKIRLWTVITKESSACLEMRSEHSFPPCRHHWITTAALFNEEKNLVVGDTCGNVYLYLLQNKEPRSMLKGLHSRYGVTSLKSCTNFILTTGGDGFIRYLSAQDNQLSLLYEFKVSFGNWLCGIFKVGPDAVVPVFKGENLQIWNISTRSLISEIKCGGGHRSWDLLVGTERFSTSGVIEELTGLNNNSKMICAFLKDGSPYVWSDVQPNTMGRTIKGSHGREIQCLEPLFHNEKNIIYAFAGEDTLLHLSLLLHQSIQNMTETKSHLSSIRSITKIESLNELSAKKGIQFLTCGGRAQMKIWKSDITALGVDVLNTHDRSLQSDERCYSDFFNPLIFCKEIASHMLTPESERSWKSSVPAYAPETRYMDCLAFWVTEDIVLIILASSDGFIRFFRYIDGEFNLFYIEDCHFCLLRLNILKLKKCKYIVATTTRGAILIWNFEIFSSYLRTSIDTDLEDSDAIFDAHYSIQVQDSGLNSIAFNCKLQEEIYGASGGDDGAIHLLKFLNSDSETNKLKLKIEICTKEYHHAAQISGLTWLDDSHLCSASIDQRIIVWHLLNGKLIPLRVHYSSVPNIQGMRLSKHIPQSGNDEGDVDENIASKSKLFVYGSGIQIFEVNTILQN